MYIYIYMFWSVKPVLKECSMKEHYNTSKVFKQRKQLIRNLKIFIWLTIAAASA